MNIQTNCLLCYRDCTKSTRRSSKPTAGKSRKINSSLLEDQVSVIFVLRKLLGVPKSFCEILLLQTGNPAGWITGCKNCNELMKNAHNIFKKLTTLQTEYQGLKNKVEKTLINSKSKTDDIGGNKTTDHIRNYLFSDLGRAKPLVKSKLKLVPGIKPDSCQIVEIDFVESDKESEESGDKELPSCQNVPVMLKDKPTESSNDQNDVIETKAEKIIESDTESIIFDAAINETPNESEVESDYYGENNTRTTRSSNNIGQQIETGREANNYIEEEAEDISCQICQKVFTRPSLLKIHNRGYHYQELNLKPYQCDVCNKIFKTGKILKVHMTMTHTKDFSAFCDVCGAGFASNSAMTRHAKNVHGEKVRIPCTLCDMTFRDRRNLKHHTARKHTQEFPLSCEICGKGSMSMTYHRRHMVKHSRTKTNTCELCGKCFKRDNNLRDHLRGEHSGELSLEPFKCVETDCCGKTFKSRSGLNKHIVEKHSKKFNFPCTECDQSFYANHFLHRHMRKCHRTPIIENNLESAIISIVNLNQ